MPDKTASAHAPIRRRTQQARTAESERRIIESARRLFSTQGYNRTTLAEVGTQAGYTAGLVSHRFGSKQGLLKAVLAWSADHFVEQQVMPALKDARPRDAITRYVEIYVTQAMRRNSVLHTLYAITNEALTAVPEVRGEVSLIHRASKQALASIVAAGIAAGEFAPNLDVTTAVFLVSALLRGAITGTRIDPPLAKQFDLTALLQAQALRMLGAKNC